MLGSSSRSFIRSCRCYMVLDPFSKTKVLIGRQAAPFPEALHWGSHSGTPLGRKERCAARRRASSAAQRRESQRSASDGLKKRAEEMVEPARPGIRKRELLLRKGLIERFRVFLAIPLSAPAGNTQRPSGALRNGRVHTAGRACYHAI